MGQGPNGRILVVEDDTLLASGLARGLAHAGFAVTLCSRGERALAGLRRGAMMDAAMRILIVEDEAAARRLLCSTVQGLPGQYDIIEVTDGDKLKLPLTRVAPVETSKLVGTLGSYWMKLPIPERWQIEKATLHFSYVNSTALIPRNSRLTVFLNSRPLAQVTLQPTSPVGNVAVSLLPRLLKPGYQEVEFNVVQHYTLDCEDPSAPELWTILELDKSYLEFEFRLKKVPLQLGAIADFLFDSRIGGKTG